MHHKEISGLYRAIYLSIFLCVFSLFIQEPYPLKWLAIGFLMMSGYWLGTIQLFHPKAVFDAQLWRLKKSKKWVLFISVFIAMAVAIYSRWEDGLPAIPGAVGPFVIIAVCIGFIEELVFRGFIQGAAGYWNPKLAILISAVAHAGYKACLFVLPEQTIYNTPLELFFYTAIAGVLFGYSRFLSGSLWPCIAAHCIFDFWVYMEQSSPPWWVW
ncbi:CPBP family intramembrane glutamic endopeptidase [Shivajiella indica]|uniref:CPBP family intramembrane glutamic endopeptidase n=1 Tax=Shivajiella indica TaxID=872115 RepID=A0ABW5BCD2_9BACT